MHIVTTCCGGALLQVTLAELAGQKQKTSVMQTFWAHTSSSRSFGATCDTLGCRMPLVGRSFLEPF